MIVELSKIYELVRMNMGIANSRQTKYYNAKRRDWQPDVNDFLYVRSHLLSDTTKGFNAKLGPKYAGPFKIIGYVSLVLVTIRKGRKVVKAPNQDLKPSGATEELKSLRYE